MPHKEESGIFKDPRRNRKEPPDSEDSDKHEQEPVQSSGERRSRCFSSAPWWLRRNYLDQE
ncbi:hypothetical protein FKG94_23150 [Exilibacterium tricleocarpae]|uniref:Uncharacterized protein n=1 Tax=Exilibacterium tricleocarpae TaxID=2591008 RepID=A0A545SXJ9_9GAMM|nr:hypothetical protein [Exilibacterium tricleocarpae]TQV69692.1 hypothetical protein FKG94_23150 [Exilibacterium tricleocarpae]